MKVALFSMGSVSSKIIGEALNRYFDKVLHYDIRRVEVRIGKGTPKLIYKGEEVKIDVDCVYLKSSFRFALIQKAIATYFGKKVYMPIDKEAFTIVNDKALTHIALEEAGVPTPDTYITPTITTAKELFDTIEFPIIMKIPGGTHGKGVMFAESIATAAGILDTLSELKQSVIIQQYIETGGEDIRAIVVGDKVVAAMKRKAVKEEKRSNIHAGGIACEIKLDSAAKKIAIKTAKALKAEICAVDLLESSDGYLVLEANLSPGLQGIMEATNLDIPDMIAKFLYERTKEFKTGKPKGPSAESLINEAAESQEQQIITSLHLRGERILLPQLVSKLSKFNEEDDVVMKVKSGRIILEKS